MPGSATEIGLLADVGVFLDLVADRPVPAGAAPSRAEVLLAFAVRSVLWGFLAFVGAEAARRSWRSVRGPRRGRLKLSERVE